MAPLDIPALREHELTHARTRKTKGRRQDIPRPELARLRLAKMASVCWICNQKCNLSQPFIFISIRDHRDYYETHMK